MNYVYCLEYGYNEYDQLGDYTAAIWSTKPDYHTIKCWFEEREPRNKIEEYVKDFKKVGVRIDAVYGMLARGERVSEFGQGGHTLEIVETPIL